MYEGRPRIDICIATYKRPTLLSNLLDSIEKNVNLHDFLVRLIIVDNDAERSGEKVVSSHILKSKFVISYVVEPKQGISNARNRALSQVKAEYLVFVDDDEVVTEGWLSALYNTLNEFNADVVFGPVVGILPADAPEWSRIHPSFSRPRLQTGSPLSHGGSGNVLLKVEALGQPFQQFNLSFNLTGGGDTEFFYRLAKRGRRLVWCDEAVVLEEVPRQRLTTKWVYKRAYRGGQCYSRIFITDLAFTSKALWLVKKLIHIFIGAFALPIVRAMSYSKYVLIRGRLLASVGQLSGLMGDKYLYDEYSSTNAVVETNGKQGAGASD